jgi:DNA helicase-2/ATP-dependent DNA helicase PcrA
VAITRARNELYLSYPLLRLVGGFSDGALQQSSRFLKELPRTLLDEWRLQPIETYPEGV